MWVIYANDISGSIKYVGEDTIVYGANTLCDSISRALVFKSKEEAEHYCDLRESSLRTFGCNLFIAELTVSKKTANWAGYFGKELPRFN